jgi:hypothetical protein
MCLGRRAHSLPEIAGTARVYFDDPVDRRLACLTAIVPKSAAAGSERRTIAAQASCCRQQLLLVRYVIVKRG